MLISGSVYCPPLRPSTPSVGSVGRGSNRKPHGSVRATNRTRREPCATPTFRGAFSRSHRTPQRSAHLALAQPFHTRSHFRSVRYFAISQRSCTRSLLDTALADSRCFAAFAHTVAFGTVLAHGRCFAALPHTAASWQPSQRSGSLSPKVSLRPVRL